MWVLWVAAALDMVVAVVGPSHAEQAQALLRKVKAMVTKPHIVATELRREEEGMSTGEIAGIVGGSVALVLVVYVIYRYKTWVPKLRPARAKAGGSTSGSDSDRLISPK